MIARTQVLVQFVVGLGYYDLGQLAEAERAFRRAENLAGWERQDGKEVLYLFLGNVAGKLERYDAARSYYGQALRIDRQYARGLVGLAETRFHQARGSCERGRVDAAGLNRAVADYRRAGVARDRPALADVDAKVAFGLGRAYVCMSQAGVADHWKDAEQQLAAVLGAYKRGNRRVKQLAAEAWANLGVVYLPPAGVFDRTRYERAAEAYRHAIELSDDPQRKGVLYGLLGYVHGKLGQRQQAHDAYQQAATMDPANRDRYAEELRRLTH